MKKTFSSLTLFMLIFSICAEPLLVSAQGVSQGDLSQSNDNNVNQATKKLPANINGNRQDNELSKALNIGSKKTENVLEKFNENLLKDLKLDQWQNAREKEENNLRLENAGKKSGSESDTNGAGKENARENSSENADKKKAEDIEVQNAVPSDANALAPAEPDVIQLPKRNAQDPLAFLKGLQGNFSTGLFTGAATFNFPIDIPEGRGEVTPMLDLTYSSTNTNAASMVGLGWNLAGGSIYRSSSKGVNTLYSEKNFTADIFGSSTELIAVELSSPDSIEGKYAAKDEEGFANYVFQNNSWTVTDTQGTKYFFGLDDASRQNDPNNSGKVYKWLLAAAQRSKIKTMFF